MRKSRIISMTTLALLTCVSQDVMAFHKGGIDSPSVLSPEIHMIGWDHKNLQAQTEGALYLRAQIEELKKQNEQLRNSLSQMRHEQKMHSKSSGNDARIQALVEENKRLEKMLRAKPSRNTDIEKSLNIYAIEIQKLKEENSLLQKRLSESASAPQTKSVSPSMKRELQSYRQENENLRQALLNQKKIKKQDSSQKVNALQGRVQKLEKENRELAQALAGETEKILMQEKKIERLGNGDTQEEGLISGLKAQLNAYKKQNTSLKQQLNKKSQGNNTASVANADVELLKKQNQSLRETIKSQSNLLVSNDNASKTAERLISENLALKRKLDQLNQTSQMNGDTAQQLFKENASLKAEIANKDKYILQERQKNKKFLNMKDEYTGDRNVLIAEKDLMNAELKRALQENEGLQEAVKQNTQELGAYEGKLNGYEREVQTLQSKNNELQKRLSDAIKERDAQRRAAAEARKENMGGRQPAKNIASSSGRKTGVTYIDTSYPPVENVKPMLNSDGNKISYTESSEELAEPDAEDLLSQGPIRDIND